MNQDLYNNAAVGSWIKDEWRNDRSMGIVISVDSETGMMLVQFPKIARSHWLRWENAGHYKTIN